MSVEQNESTAQQQRQELGDELRSLRETSRKRHFLLVSTIAAVGLAALGSVSVVGYLGSRVARQLRDFERRLEATQADRAQTERELTAELVRHRQELESLHRASEQEQGEVERSRRELQQTYSRLSTALSDQRDRLEEMHANNLGLQAELDRLERQLEESSTEAPAEEDEEDEEDERSRPVPTRLSRFTLGETHYENQAESATAGFVSGTGSIQRATAAHIPGHVLIEVLPVGAENLYLGTSFHLRVHLANRSHRLLRVESLELSWRFGEKRIGGLLEIPETEVEPRSTVLVYEVDGEWSPLQDRGEGVVEAKVLLAEGESLTNTLAW